MISKDLFEFINKFEFNLMDFNAVNHNGVTPLTLAIELDKIQIVSELLTNNANPLVENIHGNTPLQLIRSSAEELAYVITSAITTRTCKFIDYQLGFKICYPKRNYLIVKLIQAGSGCFGAMEIIDLDNDQKYFAKLKSYVGGLEIRNYIAHNQYIDLIKIEEVHSTHPISLKTTTWKQVYCLIQKYINGQVLSQALITAKDPQQTQEIIKHAIQSLARLHHQGYVHQDPLPDNCIWDPEQQKVTLVDYESMRKITDFGENNLIFSNKMSMDFSKLIIGNDAENKEKSIPGLRYYSANIEDIIENSEDQTIPKNIKTNLLTKLCLLKLN